jgi:hypothetical protein
MFWAAQPRKTFQNKKRGTIIFPSMSYLDENQWEEFIFRMRIIDGEIEAGYCAIRSYTNDQ